ncbi:MAG: FAD-dependent oxidoreductase [Hyphomicrobium sp.]|nr:FAD-dependent oxidoreductase [Hyphomicrobium sp.]
MTNRASDLPSNHSDILIAGAGIAGLATALALARTGRAVTVLEKRAESSEEGAGIQIGPNGMRILQALGVTSFLKGKIACPECIRVMDGLSGKHLTSLPLGRDIAARHGAPYGVLHRGDLHGALRTAVASMPAVTIRHEANVIAARSSSESVTVELAGGAKMQGALLIGADGIWSTLRSTVMGAPPLTFTGKCAIRTVIANDAVPPGISTTDTTIWLRPAAHVVHYPVRAGRELAIVAIFDDRALGETWSQLVEPALISDRTRSFPTVLRTLLQQPTQWRQWSLYTPEAPFRWIEKRVVLLGDAAHPPLPFLAQGGVMALEDAIVLAELLRTIATTDMPARLQDFERIRRPRTTRVMEASARNGRAYHLDGLRRRARNAVLTATPAHLFMRQYDWLYGWTVEDALTSARTPV